MLIETPPSVPVEPFPTDIAQKIWIVLDIFVPYMDTIIGLMSPAAPGVFESLITFTALKLLHIRVNS
jgi:hypothetical protein